MQHTFCTFLCGCFARLKRETSLLHIIFSKNCRMLSPKILLLVLLFPLFSLPLIFHLAGRRYSLVCTSWRVGVQLPAPSHLYLYSISFYRCTVNAISKQELNVYGSFWLNSESTTTSNVFLCEFSLVLDAKLNRRHIVFTDGNLPHRRRYLALKICYYNNSDASYQLLKLVLSGDTGVSLNPGPAEYNYNDDGEQPTQSSQSSIHACNGNSFLELPYNYLNICHYNICSLTNELDEIKLLLSSFSNQRQT